VIVIDNETTDLTAPEAAPIDQQPYITEFAGIKLDDKTLKETARHTFLCKPKVLIPPKAVEITGITNEMVAKCPPFVHFFPSLVDFFLGERIVVAHNLSYDIAVLYYELKRLQRVTLFPWPPKQICTVELTLSFKGYRMNLGDLHAELTGKPHKDAHRAMADVEGLVDIVRALRKKGLL
jgi:DNA polymerase III epsilon subunit-like protein